MPSIGDVVYVDDAFRNRHATILFVDAAKDGPWCWLRYDDGSYTTMQAKCLTLANGD
jgi:hypothetical protein